VSLLRLTIVAKKFIIFHFNSFFSFQRLCRLLRGLLTIWHKQKTNEKVNINSRDNKQTNVPLRGKRSDKHIGMIRPTALHWIYYSKIKSDQPNCRLARLGLMSRAEDKGKGKGRITDSSMNYVGLRMDIGGGAKYNYRGLLSTYVDLLSTRFIKP